MRLITVPCLQFANNVRILHAGVFFFGYKPPRVSLPAINSHLYPKGIAFEREFTRTGGEKSGALNEYMQG